MADPCPAMPRHCTMNPKTSVSPQKTTTSRNVEPQHGSHWATPAHPHQPTVNQSPTVHVGHDRSVDPPSSKYSDQAPDRRGRVIRTTLTYSQTSNASGRHVQPPAFDEIPTKLAEAIDKVIMKETSSTDESSTRIRKHAQRINRHRARCPLRKNIVLVEHGQPVDELHSATPVKILTTATNQNEAAGVLKTSGQDPTDDHESCTDNIDHRFSSARCRAGEITITGPKKQLLPRSNKASELRAERSKMRALSPVTTSPFPKWPTQTVAVTAKVDIKKSAADRQRPSTTEIRIRKRPSCRLHSRLSAHQAQDEPDRRLSPSPAITQSHQSETEPLVGTAPLGWSEPMLRNEPRMGEPSHQPHAAANVTSKAKWLFRSPSTSPFDSESSCQSGLDTEPPTESEIRPLASIESGRWSLHTQGSSSPLASTLSVLLNEAETEQAEGNTPEEQVSQPRVAVASNKWSLNTRAAATPFISKATQIKREPKVKTSQLEDMNEPKVRESPPSPPQSSDDELAEDTVESHIEFCTTSPSCRAEQSSPAVKSESAVAKISNDSRDKLDSFIQDIVLDANLAMANLDNGAANSYDLITETSFPQISNRGSPIYFSSSDQDDTEMAFKTPNTFNRESPDLKSSGAEPPYQVITETAITTNMIPTESTPAEESINDIVEREHETPPLFRQQSSNYTTCMDNRSQSSKEKILPLVSPTEVDPENDSSPSAVAQKSNHVRQSESTKSPHDSMNIGGSQVRRSSGGASNSHAKPDPHIHRHFPFVPQIESGCCYKPHRSRMTADPDEVVVSDTDDDVESLSYSSSGGTFTIDEVPAVSPISSDDEASISLESSFVASRSETAAAIRALTVRGARRGSNAVFGAPSQDRLTACNGTTRSSTSWDAATEAAPIPKFLSSTLIRQSLESVAKFLMTTLVKSSSQPTLDKPINNVLLINVESEHSTSVLPLQLESAPDSGPQSPSSWESSDQALAGDSDEGQVACPSDDLIRLDDNIKKLVAKLKKIITIYAHAIPKRWANEAISVLSSLEVQIYRLQKAGTRFVTPETIANHDHYGGTSKNDILKRHETLLNELVSAKTMNLGMFRLMKELETAIEGRMGRAERRAFRHTALQIDWVNDAPFDPATPDDNDLDPQLGFARRRHRTATDIHQRSAGVLEAFGRPQECSGARPPLLRVSSSPPSRQNTRQRGSTSTAKLSTPLSFSSDNLECRSTTSDNNQTEDNEMADVTQHRYYPVLLVLACLVTVMVGYKCVLPMVSFHNQCHRSTSTATGQEDPLTTLPRSVDTSVTSCAFRQSQLDARVDHSDYALINRLAESLLRFLQSHTGLRPQ